MVRWRGAVDNRDSAQYWECMVLGQEMAWGRDQPITEADLPKTSKLGAEYARLDDERDARLQAVAELEERLEEQRLHELTTYGRALQKHIETAARALPGLAVPVVVDVDVDATWSSSREHMDGLPPVVQRLVDEAVEAFPAPRTCRERRSPASSAPRRQGVNAPEVRHGSEPGECYGRPRHGRAAPPCPTRDKVRLLSDSTQSDEDTYGRALRYAKVDLVEVGERLLEVRRRAALPHPDADRTRPGVPAGRGGRRRIRPRPVGPLLRRTRRESPLPMARHVSPRPLHCQQHSGLRTRVRGSRVA